MSGNLERRVSTDVPPLMTVMLRICGLAAWASADSGYVDVDMVQIIEILDKCIKFLCTKKTLL
jgi:hypothetical protein